MKKMKLFTKNLLMFISPLCVSIVVFLILSSLITMTYVKDQVYKNNIALLQKAKENMELAFDDLDAISINFSTNPGIIIALKNILNDPQFVDLQTYDVIKEFLDSYVNQRLYIDSIYVYFENSNNDFLATTQGLVNLDSFYDKAWYDMYTENRNTKNIFYTKVRNIKKYSFEDEGLKVLTLSRKLYAMGSNYNNGVVMLNINIDYINKLLESSKVFPEQYIVILDKDNNIISQTQTNGFDEKGFRNIMKSDKLKNNYFITELNSGNYNMHFVSLVPKGILYSIPNKMMKISIWLFLISICIGILLAYYFTKKSYSFVDYLVKIINTAKKKGTMPTPPTDINDEYNYIIYNLLTTFIEQNYLKVQLSERMYKQKSMELIALQSQINPHFLYNTLETIHMKALGINGGPNDLSMMVENLSDILRYSLANPMQTVTLAEEIENTKSYLSIQQVRYKDKFYVRWDYNEDINEYRILKLILQPLIENCIYHGIKEKDGMCGIKIKIRLKDNKIMVAVIDDGIGISKEKLISINKNLNTDKEFSEQIGLYNIDKRLKLTYGEEYGIRIRSKLNIGTVVYSIIPVS